MTDNAIDPVPEPVRQLITVFKEKLSSVTFPDVSLAIIETLAEKVRAAEKAVDEAQKQLDAAQQALTESGDELLQKCIRGLAYTKVYAEGQNDLMERLSSINLGKSSRAVKRTAAPEKPKAEAAIPASQGSRKRSSVAAEKKEETVSA